jgi:hypothetical protein
VTQPFGVVLKEQQQGSGVEHEMGSKLSTMQDALEQQAAVADDLEAELQDWKQKLQVQENFDKRDNL